MNPSQAATDFANVGRVKCVSLGYKIKKISFLQENLTTRASSTVLENTFESKPFLIRYADNLHYFDQQLGIVGAANGIASQSVAYVETLAGNTPAPPCFTQGVNSTPASTLSSNGDMNIIWPTTQAQGALQQCEHYDNVLTGPDWGTADWTGNNYQVMQDYLEGEVFSENDDIGHTWINSLPQWHATSYARQGMASGDSVTSMDYVTPAWPENRLNMLNYPYRLWNGNMVQDLVPSSADPDSVRVGARVTDPSNSPYTSIAEDLRPAIHYLKLTPIVGPTGPINLIAYMIVEYHMTLEFEATMNTVPNIRYLAYNNGSLQNSAQANMYAITNLQSFRDPRMTWGGQLALTSGGVYPTIQHDRPESTERRHKRRYEGAVRGRLEEPIEPTE